LAFSQNGDSNHVSSFGFGRNGKIGLLYLLFIICDQGRVAVMMMCCLLVSILYLGPLLHRIWNILAYYSLFWDGIFVAHRSVGQGMRITRSTTPVRRALPDAPVVVMQYVFTGMSLSSMFIFLHPL
jgi:hypothetical protein